MSKPANTANKPVNTDFAELAPAPLAVYTETTETPATVDLALSAEEADLPTVEVTVEVTTVSLSALTVVCTVT